jgi:tRNA (cytidine/uridine-2'-O-)-methyltransferase
MMNIVLVEPEIPPNTGNIARTCAATGTVLHLIKPLGFSTADRYLKRAGMDYWKITEVRYYENLADFFFKNKGGNFYFASTKAPRSYDEVRYYDGDYFILGKETKGLDEGLLRANYDKCIRIPMAHEARSLNLSNAAAVILYEALRQNGFKTLKKEGKLSNEQ